jgi:bacterioferritin
MPAAGLLFAQPADASIALVRSTSIRDRTPGWRRLRFLRTLTMPSHPTREQLIADLNEDLSREYQAIVAYVIYSQVLKGAEYMAIAKELEAHAGQELQHALTIAKHIDYLGGMPTAKMLAVKVSEKPTEMLRADLDNENTTVRNYRARVKQCEALGEYGIGEDIREILRQEQEHQIDLATALGENVPDVTETGVR